jgi:sterol-4alpha-carboxylate 3-dehydrogenase (decarboxylating)
MLHKKVEHGVLALRSSRSPPRAGPPNHPSTKAKMTDNPFKQSLGYAFVIGGCGFLGSHIVQLILERHPHTKVAILDLRDSPSRPKNTTFFACDITDAAAVEDVFQKARPDVVIHTASPVAHGTVKMKDEVMRKVNVDGTNVLLKAAKDSGVKAFVYTSSASVATRMQDEYKNVDERWPLIVGDEQPDYYTTTKVLSPYTNCDVQISKLTET